MGQILYKQAMELSISKKPANGSPIQEQDFLIAPPLQTSLSNMNEDTGIRFSIDDGVTDFVIGMGTVTTGKILFIQPSADIKVKITTSDGDSQDLVFRGNFPSLLAITFIGLKLTNDTGSTITGKIFIVGDEDVLV